jgi:hypothetical protein
MDMAVFCMDASESDLQHLYNCCKCKQTILHLLRALPWSLSVPSAAQFNSVPIRERSIDAPPSTHLLSGLPEVPTHQNRSIDAPPSTHYRPDCLRSLPIRDGSIDAPTDCPDCRWTLCQISQTHPKLQLLPRGCAVQRTVLAIKRLVPVAQPNPSFCVS